MTANGSDPTLTACRVQPLSWRRDLLAELKLVPPAGFTLTDVMVKTAQTMMSNGRGKSGMTEQLATQRQQLTDAFHKLSESMRRSHNPLEILGRGPYMNRASYKMANMNALFGLIPGTSASNPFRYADVAGGPGGWTEYVQSQLPAFTEGFGITLKSSTSSLNWNDARLNYDMFHVYPGTGDILVEDAKFVQFVLERTKNIPLALVMCDGGDEHELSMQEAAHAPLAFHELLIGLRVLKVSGNLVIKLYDTFLPLTRAIIFAAASCFQTIHVIKIGASRATNTECYLVALERRACLVQGVEDWLDKIVPYLGDSKLNPSNFEVFSKIPQEFDNWLAENTKVRVQAQLNALTQVAAGYHAKKALLLWRVSHPSVFNSGGRTGAPRRLQDILMGPYWALTAMERADVQRRIKRLMSGYLAEGMVDAMFAEVETPQSSLQLLNKLRSLYSKAPKPLELDDEGRAAARVKDIANILSKERAKISANYRYLDVGCAEGKITGKVVEYLELKKDQAFCTDVVQQPESSRFTFVKVADEKLPFADRTFDLVTMFMSLHHIPNIALELSELRRVTKQGAVLVLREHDATEKYLTVWFDIMHALYATVFENEETPQAFLAHYRPGTYAYYRTPGQWRELFEKAGFRQVSPPSSEKGMSQAFYAIFE